MRHIAARAFASGWIGSDFGFGVKRCTAHLTVKDADAADCFVAGHGPNRRYSGTSARLAQESKAGAGAAAVAAGPKHLIELWRGSHEAIFIIRQQIWASIDQTPASGNALDIAGYCSIGLCVKAPAAKVGRSNRLGRASRSRAAGVPDGIRRWRFSAAHPSVVGMSAIGVTVEFGPRRFVR